MAISGTGMSRSRITCRLPWTAALGTDGAYGAPPSTRMTAPVVKLAEGLARNSAAPTISSGSPPRPSANRCLKFSNVSGGHALEMSVRNGPAWMQFTRTLRPKAKARSGLGS